MGQVLRLDLFDPLVLVPERDLQDLAILASFAILAILGRYNDELGVAVVLLDVHVACQCGRQSGCQRSG